MKTILIAFLSILIVFSCKKTNIMPIDIIGKWNNSYQIQTKNAKGKWSDWTIINSLVALPTLEFTADGKILWDGKQSDFCFTPRTYNIVNKDILSFTTGNNGCELIDSAPQKNKWIIEKLTSNTLEINQYYQKSRYFKDN
jgi:hypothetical protein